MRWRAAAIPSHARLPVRALVVIGAILLAALGASSPTRAQGGDLTVVRQSYPSRVATFWPNYVAAANGYYAKLGLSVQDLVLDPTVTTSALMGGSVDISYADTTQLMLAVEKGAPLIAVGLGAERQPYKLMAPSGVKTVADLKGKKIGVAALVDIYTYVVKQILRKAGLDPEHDVEFIGGGGQNQRLSAIISGAVQGGLFSPPSDEKLRALGFNTLAFTPDYFPNLTLSVTTVRRDWAEAHSDTLRKLLLAQSEAVRWLNTPANKAEALKILESAINVSPAEAEDAYDYYIGKHTWTDACVHRSGLTSVVDIMHATHQLTTLTTADVSKFADTTWCPRS